MEGGREAGGRREENMRYLWHYNRPSITFSGFKARQ